MQITRLKFLLQSLIRQKPRRNKNFYRIENYLVPGKNCQHRKKHQQAVWVPPHIVGDHCWQCEHEQE